MLDNGSLNGVHTAFGRHLTVISMRKKELRVTAHESLCEANMCFQPPKKSLPVCDMRDHNEDGSVCVAVGSRSFSQWRRIDMQSLSPQAPRSMHLLVSTSAKSLEQISEPLRRLLHLRVRTHGCVLNELCDEGRASKKVRELVLEDEDEVADHADGGIHDAVVRRLVLGDGRHEHDDCRHVLLG